MDSILNRVQGFQFLVDARAVGFDSLDIRRKALRMLKGHPRRYRLSPIDESTTLHAIEGAQRLEFSPPAESNAQFFRLLARE